MKYLTFGPNPYLLKNHSILHASLLRILSDKVPPGDLYCAATYFNTDYFMCDESLEQQGEQRFFFEGVEISPISERPERLAVHLTDVVRKFQPDVIISVGGIETGVIQALKTLYEHVKWIAILSDPSEPIIDILAQPFDDADVVLPTTISLARRFGTHLSAITGPSLRYYPFEVIERKQFNAISLARNLQICNPWAIADAALEARIPLYMHISLYEKGDYDLLPLRGYSNIRLPEKFLSSEEGYCPYELKREFEQASIVMDFAMQSSTASAVLHGMRVGCLPLVTECGALADVVRLMSEPSLFIVRSVSLKGGKGELLKVADPFDAVEKLKKLKKLWEASPETFFKFQIESQQISQRYSQELFELELEFAFKRIEERKPPRLLVQEF